MRAQEPGGQQVNPWLAALQDQPVADADPYELDDIDDAFVLGAQVPIGLDVDVAQGLPSHPVGEAASTTLVFVVGVHGGAGATTVAGLLAAAEQEHPPRPSWSGPRTVMESRQHWPIGVGQWVPSATLLVARTHAAGLDLLTQAARQWATGRLIGVRLVGVVLVDDGPRLTSRQRAEVERVSSLTPRTWRLGWQDDWRDLVQPGLGEAARPVRRTVVSIVNASRQLRGTPGGRESR